MDLIDASSGNPENKPKKRPPFSTRHDPQYVPFAMDMIAASHYCSVGTTVLYNAVNDGDLRMRKLNGKSLFFREDLEEWLHNNAHESMPVPKRRAAAPAEAKPAGAA